MLYEEHEVNNVCRARKEINTAILRNIVANEVYSGAKVLPMNILSIQKSRVSRPMHNRGIDAMIDEDDASGGSWCAKYSSRLKVLADWHVMAD